MSRHVANDTPCCSNFGQMGPCRRHYFFNAVAVCVGSSRHLLDFSEFICRNILWYGGTYVQILLHPHALNALISWFCCFHQDHLFDRHYNTVAEIISSVCDWARLDLCQKPQGPASLIECMEDGCNRVLHHMCRCMWESDDQDVRQAHGTRKFCAYHHPALAKGQYHAETGPPSNLPQGLSQSTMETMSTMTTVTSLSPLGNINITGQSLPADGQEDF